MPHGSQAIGRLPATAALTLEVVLRPRHAGELAALASAVSDPSSPSYRHFLPPDRFRARFGPAAGSFAALKRWLDRAGVRVAGLAPDGLAVRVHGTATAIERAFATRLEQYRLRDGTRAYATLAAPLVPAALAPELAGIIGLDSLTTPRRAGLSLGSERFPGSATSPSPAHAGATATAPPASSEAAAPAGRPQQSAPSPSAACATALATSGAGYSLDQVASYYGLDPAYLAGDEGAGASVGLIEFAPFVAGDLAAFEQCYDISPQVSVMPVAGGPGTVKPESTVETELDLELVAGLAPAAKITVYEAQLTATSAYDAFAAAVSDDTTQVLSTSWGACEPLLGSAALSAEATLFEQAALQGQTIVAAAGDSGSEDCSGSVAGPTGNALEVDDPASQPFVTGVGGTTLTLSSPLTGGAATASEIAWNTGSTSPDPGAGGGGVSRTWPMPPYQHDAAATLGVVGPQSACPPKSATGGTAGDCREVPDVSADAGSPIAVYCTLSEPQLCGANGWTPLDGTSAAAPIWAALFALADANPACATTGPLGFANPALYALAGGPSYATAFHDVTSGNNDLTGTNGGKYAAGPGYDLATGLGTPIAGSGTGGGLIAGLCAAGSHALDLASLPAPEISKLSPATARSRGGAHIVITGSGFSAVTAVRFGARPAVSFRIISSTRLVAIAPPGHHAVHVTVIAGGRRSPHTPADVFGYLSPPLVVSLSPNQGPAAGGTVVTIHGVYLSRVRAVLFGTTPASKVVDRSGSELIVTAPKGAGTVTVRVVTAGGTSAPRRVARFSYSAG